MEKTWIKHGKSNYQTTSILIFTIKSPLKVSLSILSLYYLHNFYILRRRNIFPAMNEPEKNCNQISLTSCKQDFSLTYDTSHFTKSISAEPVRALNLSTDYPEYVNRCLFFPFPDLAF